MIRAEDLGERTKVEIAGRGEQLLIEFGQIVRSLNKNVPTELLKDIFKMAVEMKDDEEDKDEEEDEKDGFVEELVKDFFQKMKEENKRRKQ